MLEMFTYAFGIMYTPGPVNFLGLRSGVNLKLKEHIRFFIGVGSAMFLLFLFLGFIGLKIVNQSVLPYVSSLGCLYIIYVAWKVFKSNNEVPLEDESSKSLTFLDGLLMQLLNPKALLATLPISTIQFPALGITGGSIFMWSSILAVIAFGAPASYSVIGYTMGKRIENPRYFKYFNNFMSILLVYVAVNIFYEHVYITL